MTTVQCAGRWHNAARWLRSEVRLLVAALVSLVWPVDCAGCGMPDVALCRRCAQAVGGPPFMIAPAPGSALHELTSGSSGASPVPVWGLSAYGGTAAALIVAWKDRGRADLSRPLGAALAAAVLECRRTAPENQQREIWLVPMPARRAALRSRGANLGHDLARSAARAAARATVGATARADPGVRAAAILRHVRRVRDQVGLDAAERTQNLAGSFGLARRFGRRPSAGFLGGPLAKPLRGRRCIVVDDIVTTGASVTEAVRVLSRAGAQVVGVCCLSVTFKQRGVPETQERTSLAAWKAPSGW